MTKSLIIILIALNNIVLVFSATTNTVQSSNSHPSILINQDDDLLIKRSVNESPSLKIIHEIIIGESNRMLSMPCLKYEKIGWRLLDVSRECFRRVFFLSYAYRFTGNEKYAKCAEAEMLAVSEFKDWNPTHFLDVAEMTFGVAIGYDWLYNYLSDDSKNKIGDAIINHGIKPSMDTKYNGWLNSSSNWNQVCNVGIMYGAIAIRDRDPELAKTIIDRSVKSVLIPMIEYEPEGTYPEGFMYWGYGTTMNVFLISAAEKFTGKELFPVAKMQGFIRSASYILNIVGPTGKSFNYSDSRESAGFNPAIFWFAKKTNDLGLLWNEKKYITHDNLSRKADRFLPAAILWGAGLKVDASAAQPKSNFWLGQGKTPVCLMRTSWTDKNAIFLGFKAGSPMAGHAHLDVGSFVMDANGVRWAADFGMQDYNTLESKGVNLWSIKQNSDRWNVFRYNNFTHNTLTFNDSLQRVEGASKIDSYTNKKNLMSATSDISSVYTGQVKSAVRSASIVNKSYVTIKDVIETLGYSTKLRWTLLTEGEPVLNQRNNTILLTKDGKKLLFKVKSSVKVTLKTWSVNSPNEYDAPNPGKYLVGFEAQLHENSKTFFDVSLIPEK